MMPQTNISVIIPVYGVEKYIEKCIRSLFEQTMKTGIEFIFIDDCTKDRSLEIIRKVLLDYPHRHSQVRIIHHSINLGLAEARVTGVHNAQGEFIIHCDSDDWVAPSMYEELYKKAKETDADIVGCDYIQVLKEGERSRKCDFSLATDQLITELIRGEKVEGYLWNRLVKRSFYMKGAYRAEKGVTFLEDMAVTVPMHLDAKKVAYVPKPLYYYRRTNNNSMSQSSNERNILSAIRVLSRLSSLNMKEEWRKEVNTRMKFYLFARILAPSVREVNSWSNQERVYIRENQVDLSFFESLNMWLIDRNMTSIQAGLMLLYKLHNKITKVFK